MIESVEEDEPKPSALRSFVDFTAVAATAGAIAVGILYLLGHPALH